MANEFARPDLTLRVCVVGLVPQQKKKKKMAILPRRKRSERGIIRPHGDTPLQVVRLQPTVYPGILLHRLMDSRFASSSSQANAQLPTPMEQQALAHAAKSPIAFTHAGHVAKLVMVLTSARAKAKVAMVTKAKVAKAKAAKATAKVVKAELIKRAYTQAFHQSVAAEEMAVHLTTCPQPLPSHRIQQACSTNNLQQSLTVRYQLGIPEQQRCRHSRRSPSVTKRPWCILLLRKSVHRHGANRSHAVIGLLLDRTRWAL